MVKAEPVDVDASVLSSRLVTHIYECMRAVARPQQRTDAKQDSPRRAQRTLGRRSLRPEYCVPQRLGARERRAARARTHLVLPQKDQGEEEGAALLRGLVSYHCRWMDAFRRGEGAQRECIYA
jgi:hypothetical protein